MSSKNQKQDMEAALKTLWGASAWPFAAAVKDPCETPAHEETLRRLEPCMAVHSSGVLHGPNGVGKSRLVQSLVERLPQKTYRTLVLSYSSLTGTDVMRYLCHLHGLNLAQRRSDNLMALRTMWGQRDGLWPVRIGQRVGDHDPSAPQSVQPSQVEQRCALPDFGRGAAASSPSTSWPNVHAPGHTPWIIVHNRPR